MLDLPIDQLLARASKLYEVDLEGARRYVRNLVREDAEFSAIRDDLEDGAAQLVEESCHLRCLGDGLGQCGAANNGSSGRREVYCARVCLTHSNITLFQCSAIQI